MKRIAVLTAVLATGGVVLGPFGLGRTPTDVAVAEAAPVLDPSLIADVAERVTPSVVNVSTTTVTRARQSAFDLDPFFGDDPRTRERSGKSLGSGVIVSARGLVLTNNHVVANASQIQVSTEDGTEYTADLVGADPKSDLAVLKLRGNPKGLVPLKFGDSSRLRLGEVVLAVGNPFGIGQTVTMGIVSAKGRTNLGIVPDGGYEDFIQTDAAINMGNSGGALVNLRGELVGINTAILGSRTGGNQGIGFAIPSDMAAPIMKMLVDKGKVVRGWLGVGIQDVTRELADALKLSQTRGVLVTSVARQSPAAKAGLARGDVIVSVAGKPTPRSGNLRNAVAAAAGSTVAIEFYRGKARQTAQVAVIEQPGEPRLAGAGDGGDDRAGGAKSGGLGIQVVPVSPASRKKYGLPRELEHGVVVTDVVRGSMAEEMGLQPGDVLLEVNRAAINGARDIAKELERAPRRLALLVYRDGATVYLMIQK